MAAEAHAAYVRRTAGFEVAGVARSAGAGGPAARQRPRSTSCCSTCTCPTGTGSACCRAARRGLLCDVIAVTSARDLEVVQRAVSQGVVLYLLKPFTFAGFRTKLDQYADYRARLAASEDASARTRSTDARRLRAPSAADVRAQGDERRHAARGHPALRDGAGPLGVRGGGRSAHPGSPPAATWSTSPTSGSSSAPSGTAAAGVPRWSTAGPGRAPRVRTFGPSRPRVTRSAGRHGLRHRPGRPAGAARRGGPRPRPGGRHRASFLGEAFGEVARVTADQGLRVAGAPFGRYRPPVRRHGRRGRVPGPRRGPVPAGRVEPVTLPGRPDGSDAARG